MLHDKLFCYDMVFIYEYKKVEKNNRNEPRTVFFQPSRKCIELQWKYKTFEKINSLKK